MKFNKGQEKLYNLIKETLCQGKELPRKKYVAIYRKYVERDANFYWKTENINTGEIKKGKTQKSDDWRDDNADAWVIRTLGLFIKHEIFHVIIGKV